MQTLLTTFCWQSLSLSLQSLRAYAWIQLSFAAALSLPADKAVSTTRHKPYKRNRPTINIHYDDTHSHSYTCRIHKSIVRQSFMCAPSEVAYWHTAGGIFTTSALCRMLLRRILSTDCYRAVAASHTICSNSYSSSVRCACTYMSLCLYSFTVCTAREQRI